MSDLKAFGWSAVAAINVQGALALLLWLFLGPFGLFLLAGAWPLLGGAAFFITWICCPSPAVRTGKVGVRGQP